MKLPRCNQCYRRRDPEQMVGLRGLPSKTCIECRKKYSTWRKLSLSERAAFAAGRFVSAGAYRARLVVPMPGAVHNVKTGSIPISMTGRGSCPDACTFKANGCYAEYNFVAIHWRRIPDRGKSWSAFCADVAALPKGQLWRHNEAGDLPGIGNRIDPAALGELVAANRGRRGFSFTHKPMFAEDGSAHLNQRLVRMANRKGFVVNLSADSMEDADRLAALAIAPVAVVLPHDAPSRATKTAAGRTVVVCPAQTTEGMTCERCRLCAKGDRKSIVGFRAHGQFKARVTELVQIRRSA